MKKVIILIVIISSLGIAAFIWYMSTGVDRNEVFYKTLVTYEDVAYKTAEGKELTIDILMPQHVYHDQIPVVFYVHGGSFISGEKSDLTDGVRRYVAEEILDDGYAIISIEYRYLDEDTHFPASIIDVKDAIRYISSAAESYNFDTDNFGLWGSGAGAYLALTAAYSPSGLFLGDYDLREYSADVNYVIDMSGLTNIATARDISSMNTEELASAQAELDTLYSIEMDIYNLSDDDYEEMALYDPLSYISHDTIPTYIIHGLNDDLVNVEQSNILEDELLLHGITYEYYKVLGGDNDLSGLADSEITIISGQITYFIKSNYIETE